MKFKYLLALSILVSASGQLAAQISNDCGEPPIKPNIVDGATATWAQLVANSGEVNAFIEAADIFLDCKELQYKRNSTQRSRKDQIGAEVRAMTELRNETGDEFNDQVAAYQAANPQ